MEKSVGLGPNSIEKIPGDNPGKNVKLPAKPQFKVETYSTYRCHECFTVAFCQDFDMGFLQDFDQDCGEDYFILNWVPVCRKSTELSPWPFDENTVAGAIGQLKNVQS